jgi:pyruvate/2-oxoacid:ferredoxin oxidoreductase alpha subunit
MRQLIKGNVAVVHAAVRAGCRAFFGYPITPASEIAEAASIWLPKVGGAFLQAESEIGAIQMVYGAASAGIRVMTASSGPGISLMQEGISYLAGSELPCVIVDIMRGGPGLGNIAPEQGDYFQIVKGGGHGNYRNLVLAPNSVQEMCDLTVRAFEMADRYRNPVVLLADGVLGQMMESVVLPEPVAEPPDKPWAVTGEAMTRRNLISSIYLQPEELEAHINKLQEKYRLAEEREPSHETFQIEDASIILVSYGITSRVAKEAVEAARNRGLRVGLFRPITLFPFPRRSLRELSSRADAFLVVELSHGQLLEDVRLAVEGRARVNHMSRTGGMIPQSVDILAVLRKLEMECVGNHA